MINKFTRWMIQFSVSYTARKRIMITLSPLWKVDLKSQGYYCSSFQECPNRQSTLMNSTVFVWLLTTFLPLSIGWLTDSTNKRLHPCATIFLSLNRALRHTNAIKDELFWWSTWNMTLNFNHFWFTVMFVKIL